MPTYKGIKKQNWLLHLKKWYGDIVTIVHLPMPLKILMFGWEFPPFNSGGLGIACLGLTRALSKKGVEITFVLPRHTEVGSRKVKFLFADSGKSKIYFKRISNILIEPYMSVAGYKTARSLHKKKTGYGSNIFAESRRYSRGTALVVKGCDFDIIHAHDWMSFPAGIDAERISGKPLVVHIHSTVVDRTGGSQDLNPEIFRIEKEGMEVADAVVTVSGYTKKIITDIYGIPAGKVHVVHNGIDLNDYLNLRIDSAGLHALKDCGNKVVLFVGRLTIQKGVDYFLQAAKRVLQYFPKAIFVVVGSGDMEHQLINEAADLGISDKVLFTGFLRGEQLKKVYQMADLFVMPSVSEPFGLAALESVVHGTPVLISKQSGVKETLTHALIVDFWDTEEMAGKILAVLAYDSLQLSLKQNAFEQVKGIHWEQAAQKCLDVYQDVLNKYFQNYLP